MSPIILGGNWWNILIVLEAIEEQKIPERSSYAILKRVVWLYSVTAFLITFQKKNIRVKRLRQSLNNLDGQNNQGAQKSKHLRN